MPDPTAGVPAPGQRQRERLPRRRRLPRWPRLARWRSWLRRRRWRRWLRSSRWGLGTVAFLFLVAATAPVIAPYDAAAQLDPEVAALRPPATVLAAVHLAG
ncbi:MAG TPA: hypothetical protein VE075_00630, partial [Thermoanaerobaculia bacterium]|nr:hypothetical protein [Thermoanaerobaculia bacterium]